MKNFPAEKNRITYVAFLRGINVGGNTLIKMEDLRKAFESYGYGDVKTVLASGNVIFTAEDDSLTLSQNITIKLQETFGHEIPVIIRSIEDLLKIEALQPFKGIGAAPQVRFFVTFVSENVKHRDVPGPSMHEGFRILDVGDGMICSMLNERPGVGAVHLMSAIEKEFGKKVTTRSWNTIIRILNITRRLIKK